MSEPASTAALPGQANTPLTIPDHTLLRRIGEGSYGEVWLARSALGTFRAVKIAHRPASGDGRAYEREFTGLKNFEPISRGHDGLVDILQVGRNDEAGYFYCVMELADDASQEKEQRGGGEKGHLPPAPFPLFSSATYQPATLESRIRANGRLSVPECVRIAATVADALRYLHGHGLVHRDIKPSNIIFVDGVPKLADVGLVARTDSAQTFVGTEGYIPPEGPGTPGADIYSLGKCLYEMAMGKDRQAYPSPPTLLDELPDRRELVELNDVITRACERKPAGRYESVAEMHRELGLLRAGRSVQEARARQRRRRIVRRVATVVATLLAIGCVALLLLSRPRLAVVHTLEMPADWAPQPPLVGDRNGDGTPDLYLVGGDHVWVISAAGEILGNSQFGSGSPLYGNLVADVNGDKASELFLGWRDGTNLHLGVFNHINAELKHFTAQGAPPRDRSGNRASQLEAVAFADLRNDGQPEVIAALMTGNGGQPRELRGYDYASGTLSWQYQMAAMVNGVVLADLDADGLLDLLCGSAAVNNGSKLADGTDDDHTYLYAIRGDGTKLWTQRMGETYARCEPLIANATQATNSVYAVVSRGEVRARHNGPSGRRHSDSCPDCQRGASEHVQTFPWLGEIVRLDGKTGRELRRYSVGMAVSSAMLGNPVADGQERLLAADARGFLHTLDLDLNLLSKRRVVPCLYDRVNLTLAAVADLDGDGQQELLFTSQQVRRLTEHSLTGLDDKPEVKHALDNCLLLFDARMKLLGKHTLAEKWESNWGIHVAVLHLPGQRHKSIVVVADKVHFLRYSRW